VQVQAVGGLQTRQDVFRPQSLDGGPRLSSLMASARTVPRHQPGIGERRVRTIEQSKLRSLVAADVVRQRGTGGLPIRRLAAETTLDHPLDECFALHGPPVLEAQHCCTELRNSLVVAGVMLSTIVRGKEYFALDPASEFGVQLARELRRCPARAGCRCP